ncbi:sulfatase family protein [Oceaniferula marina]
MIYKRMLHLATIALIGLSSVSLQADQTRPNILFVMSDDHTSQAIGAYGGRLQSLNPTPTIDQLAKEGMLMENAFCNNSICTPSRASIMTGQYSAVNGVITLREPLQPKNHYLAIEMKKAGYTTAVVGKWHLKVRPSTFDYYKVVPEQGKYINPEFFEGTYGDTKGTLVKMEGHSSDCITDSALAWLKGRDQTKPFFLKYHFKAPHDRFVYAPRYESYLADVHIPEPASLYERGNHGSIATRGHNDELIHKIGTSIGRRHERRNYIRAWANDPNLSDDEAKSMAYQEYLKRYLRCVKGVDDNLKRVIDYLKKEGLYDNTVIIYTGDQGFYLGEHDYMDKRWCYEEGMRMPLIICYPKAIEKGSRADAIVENVDYAPTMLDFAGVKTLEYMQGRSFKSILETGVEPKGWKQSAYYHYWMHMSSHANPAHIAIRTKRYKLIMFYGTLWFRGADTPSTPPGWELYDLKTDPKEMNNLYDNPEYASVVAELKIELKELRAKYKEDDPQILINKVINDYWDYDEEDRANAIAISNAMKKEVYTKKKKSKKKGK